MVLMGGDHMENSTDYAELLYKTCFSLTNNNNNNTS